MEARFTKPTNIKKYPFCSLLFQASHILVGGTTGSGKSVLIDDLVYSYIGKYYPNEIEFVLIDPKRVSLSKYRNLPHTIAYGCENSDIINIFKYVIRIMEKRYDEMQKANLVQYEGPYIMIIVDELADLMTTCKKEISPLIQRIAQLGRAARVKLLCATQAPNRKILDSNIIINFDGRLALRCLSSIESRQIINRNGAEKLPQNGKALYLHNNGRYYEISVPLTPENEIKRLISSWEVQTPPGWNAWRTYK